MANLTDKEKISLALATHKTILTTLTALGSGQEISDEEVVDMFLGFIKEHEFDEQRLRKFFAMTYLKDVMREIEENG